MADRKKVTLDVAVKTQENQIDSLEKKLDSAKKKANELSRQKLQMKLDADTSRLEETNKKISNIKKSLDGLKNPDITILADDSQIKAAEKELKDLQGEQLDLELSVADDELKVAKREIDDMKGEVIDIDIDVDDSKLKSSFDSTSNAITGVVSTMAGKSIWDMVYGTSAKAETNKVLLKNMSDTGTGFQTLYNTIDKTTDSSLISMQQLIPALNGIKAATGATATEINNITPGVASFGQYVYALTGSSAKAEEAMFNLSKGIKGAYASLDQYGITEEALMRTGLWSGKEDDVEGFIKAVNAATGSTDELMNTATGLEALIGKAFSRAGKRIGNDLLPYIEQAMRGFLDLDAATGGWMSTIILGGGGVISGIGTIGSSLQQVRFAIDNVRDGWGWVSDKFTGDGGIVSSLSNIKTHLVSVGSSAKNAAVSIGTTLKSALVSAGTAAKSAAISFGTWLKNALITAGSSAKAAAISFGTTLKSALISAGNAAKSAIIWIANAGKAALTAGYNALKAAAMWLYEKVQVAASAVVKAAAVIPTLLLAAAEWLLANPIILVAAAILIVIGVLWYLYNTNETVRNGINGLAEGFTWLCGVIYNSVVGAFQWLQGAWANTVAFFQEYGQLFLEIMFVVLTGPVGVIALLIANFMGMPNQIGGALQNALQRVINWGSSIVSNMWNTATRSVNNFMNQIRSLPGKFINELNRMLSAVNQWAATLPAKFWQAGVNAVKNFLNALGIHSPGFMQVAFKQEIGAMEDIAEDTNLAQNVGQTAKAIINNWGYPALGFDYQNDALDNNFKENANNDLLMQILEALKNIKLSNSMTFNLYGDMDNEDRMEKFIEAVRREINWNNNLAGRTADI